MEKNTTEALKTLAQQWR